MKNLPCACNKTQLYDALKPIGRDEIKEVMYKIIMKFRKCELIVAKNKKIIFKNEVIEIMKSFGELELNNHDLSNVA